MNRIMRIYSQNINRISKYTEYDEQEVILQVLHEHQIDVACVTEINLDLTKALVKYKLNKKARKFDKNKSLIMASSSSFTLSTKTKRGGLLTYTRDNWSGREIEKGKENLGRWTYVTLSGKANSKVIIITLYRVCNQKNYGDGGCTIYMQQEADLQAADRKCIDPQEAILDYLTEYITTLKRKQYDVIYQAT